MGLCMKKSLEFTPGVYQFEWRNDRIEIVEWSEPPISTNQYVVVHPDPGDITSKHRLFYLEGTCNEDIALKAVPDDQAFESFMTCG